MSAEVHYFSPTTPGASSFDVDVSAFVRRGRIGPLSGEAEMAAVGTGNQQLDDVDGTLGHDDDSILGLKQWYFDETECPSGNQRVYTGYTFDRRYARADSLVQGVARNTDVTLMDLNSFLSFRVFAPEDSDPTSSFVRPAETTIERIQALLNDVDFLSTTLFDLGYIPTTGGVDMDANDYTQQKPYDVVNSIAQVSGWNPWVGYDETESKLFLWFDDWKTDGADTVPYDSTLRLTNVASEVDATTLLIELNGVETSDPSRVISAVWVNGKDGVSVYRTMPTTAYTFGWRDAVMDATYLSDPVKLAALGDRYLLDNSTEDHRISVTVQVPASLVTAIHEGMRIQLHATHMPSVTAGFTYCRILQRTVRRELETMEYYWLDLELSPIPPVVEPFGILYRPQSADTNPGETNPIGWICSGDPQPCSIDTYGVQPTVGPLAPTPGTISGTIGVTQYLGFTFSGSGTIDFTSTWLVFTACSLQQVYVDILIEGVVVATGGVVTTGGTGNPPFNVDATGIAVSSGDVLTAQFRHAGGACSIYVDGVAGNFTITGGALS